MKKLTASVSAVALVLGGTMFGTGFATAQPTDPGDAQLASQDFDTDGLRSQLQTAVNALKGPVSVESRPDNGPSVTYTNRTDSTEPAAQKCIGFTTPYSTIEKLNIDPSNVKADPDNPFAALELLQNIEEEGGVSVLTSDEQGQAAVHEVDLSDEGAATRISASLIALLSNTAGVTVQPGETATWLATSPSTEPAAAGVLCIPTSAYEKAAGNPFAVVGDLQTNFGVDKQVVADQFNDKLTGGKLELVTPGSISVGSLEFLDSAIGSMTGQTQGSSAGSSEGN